MGRIRVGMYESSTLIIEASIFFSKKVNHVRSEPLKKEMKLGQLHATEDYINSFPSSYYNKNKNGEKYGEPIFMDLKFCHDTIGAHYNDMIMQDGHNKVEFGRT